MRTDDAQVVEEPARPVSAARPTPDARPHPVADVTWSSVREYQGGHFHPYVSPLFDDVVADQLAFLRTHVPALRS